MKKNKQSQFSITQTILPFKILTVLFLFFPKSTTVSLHLIVLQLFFYKQLIMVLENKQFQFNPIFFPVNNKLLQ
jgi:hypothetical protein